MSVVSAVCCQVEVSALGRSLVQRSPTDCGVSECGREASIMRRPWPTGGSRAMWEGGGGGDRLTFPYKSNGNANILFNYNSITSLNPVKFQLK